MKKNDIQHSLIIVAEAVKKEDGSRVVHKYMDGEQRLGGIGDYIAQELMKKTDVECRVTSLGHVQRGAPPTASDRILASAFGVYAVDLLNQKKFDRMVAWRDRRVVDVPIDEGIKTYKNVGRKDSLGTGSTFGKIYPKRNWRRYVVMEGCLRRSRGIQSKRLEGFDELSLIHI